MVPLAEALALADAYFGVERILAEAGRDFVGDYYRQSLLGYATLYNRWQCMHVALHDEGLSEEDAFFAQAAAVARGLGPQPGQRVLELGCGLGANSLHLAARFPHVEFIGLDLMPAHVSRAGAKGRDLPNLAFRQGSYEDLPADLGTFDAIFGVETLCYAQDMDRVAESVARHLRPGGRFILYDPHRKPGFESYPAEMITATRLYEITTAVARGFHEAGRWEAALARAGLTGIETEDLTLKAHEALVSLHRRATKAFTERKWRTALRLMPRYFARNTVAGLLGYHVCFGDVTAPDPARGAVVYQKVTAWKPA